MFEEQLDENIITMEPQMGKIVENSTYPFYVVRYIYSSFHGLREREYVIRERAILDTSTKEDVLHACERFKNIGAIVKRILS